MMLKSLKNFIIFLLYPVIAIAKLTWAMAMTFWLLAKRLCGVPGQFSNVFREVSSRSEELKGKEITYEDIKKEWGLCDKRAENQHLRDMNWRMLIWSIPGAVAIACLAAADRTYLLHATIMYSISAIGIVTSLWRKLVVKHREFVPFFEWLQFWR